MTETMVSAGPERTVAYLLSSLIQAIENCRKSGNDEWLQKHGERLASIVDSYMPSGSGWDEGTTFDMDKSSAERLVFHGSFHHMDDAGGYDGWTDHTITVRPTFTGLDIRISGRDRNEVKEHLYQTFSAALETKVAAV
jgi:hypothetical protein